MRVLSTSTVVAHGRRPLKLPLETARHRSMGQRQDTCFPFTIHACITELSANQPYSGPVVNRSRSGMAARLPVQLRTQADVGGAGFSGDSQHGEVRVAVAGSVIHTRQVSDPPASPVAVLSLGRSGVVGLRSRCGAIGQFADYDGPRYRTAALRWLRLQSSWRAPESQEYAGREVGRRHTK